MIDVLYVYCFKSVGSYKHKLSRIESLVILYWGINCTFVLFVWFNSLRPSQHFFSHVGMGQEYHLSVKQIGSRSGLILVQFVCKCYEQTMLVGSELIHYYLSCSLLYFCLILPDIVVQFLDSLFHLNMLFFNCLVQMSHLIIM